jgi:SAM-dependent MidA family methyltransferase
VDVRSNSGPAGITIEPFAVPGKIPLYLETEDAKGNLGSQEGDTVGLKVMETGNGHHFFYIPGCAMLDDTLRARLKDAPLVFFDGTLYTNDEMIAQGLLNKTGDRIGHMNMSGKGGTVEQFAPLNVGRKIFIHINNSNPVLRDKQQTALSGVRNIQWHTSLDEVPPGPAIILANEYLDVLPIHQMVKRETGWHERVVELDKSEKLVFAAAAEPTPRFEVTLPPLVRAAPSGAVFEWRPDSEIMKVAKRVRDQDGAAVIIDYGHMRSDAGDTFQAIARHSFTDPLKNPGQADVTAHVDFQALTRAADDLGARVHGPVSQGDFLKRLGIETRAVTLMAKTTPEVSADISSALKRLTDSGRGGMGSMFKVLAVTEPNLTSVAGFSDEPSAPGEETA